MTLDRGRVLFTHLRGIQFEERSGQETWNNSRALVAKSSAVEFDRQPENCIRCPQGALVDVTEIADGKKQFKRALYCLAGVQDPQVCCVPVLENRNLMIDGVEI